MADHGSSPPSLAQQKRKCPGEETGRADAPAMCANGCGFFGAPETGNMCSKCYREHVLFAGAAATSVVSSAPPAEKKARTTRVGAVASCDGSANAAVVDPSVTAVGQMADAKTPKAANRCLTCHKKVGLTGFRCRCEGTFCSVHRYSDTHECGYDFKSEGREKIAKQNPVVVADKITRI